MNVFSDNLTSLLVLITKFFIYQKYVQNAPLYFPQLLSNFRDIYQIEGMIARQNNSLREKHIQKWDMCLINLTDYSDWQRQDRNVC